MQKQITAQQVVDRIAENLGRPWTAAGADVFHAGDPESPVTGIATSFTPSLEVLRRAVAEKKNMIITRQPPYWHDRFSRGYSGSGAAARDEQLHGDATYRIKHDYITENHLILWRFRDNWDARMPDGQLRGLAEALGWTGRQKTEGSPFFTLPAVPLEDLAKDIRERLKASTLRVIGDPGIQVSRVALSHGLCLVPDVRELLKQEPDLDAIVIGEPVEWEASPYFADLTALGQKKGMIILGHLVSEEPGSGEVARWLQTFIDEVPVKWIPSDEPFWLARA